MKSSKYVESWFVTKDPNGIYTLIINTTERYCYHHHFSDDECFMMFQISLDEDEDMDFDNTVQYIPTFLPKLENGLWLEASQVVKEQIHYYFIPHLHEWSREHERIVSKSWED